MSHSFITHNIRNLLIRTFIFLLLFSIAVGICVNWLVDNGFYMPGNYWIYGNKGKLIILLAILFPFVIREKRHLLPKLQWDTTQFLFGSCFILSLLGFFVITPISYFYSHIFLILSPLFLLIFIFGLQFLTKFVRVFIKELLFMLGIGLAFYFFIPFIWNLWPLFSEMVLRSVSTIFSFFFSTRVISPDILVVESFRVRVGEECSGLESLFMFSALYILIGSFERKVIHIPKYALAYIPLAIGLYLVNILRVFIIILVGVVWSEELSIQLFHTYLGMIFFVMYFLLFIRFLYPRLKK